MTAAALRGFKMGALRERVQIQEIANTDSTTGQPQRNWVTVLEDEPAAYMPVAGSEVVRGRQVEAGITAVFTVNHCGVFHPEQRLVHENQMYGVVYVKHLQGGRRYLELHCKGIP